MARTETVNHQCKWFPLYLPFWTLLLAAPPAYAGMPFLALTDIASMRMEALGFFFGLFLAIAAIVRGLWAVARRDFPALPAPTFRLSLAFVFAVALLLQVVLTMISGARELMTPGAWEKRGVTYRLKGEDEGLAALPHARVARLEDLRDALWRYAAQHDGRLPPNDIDPGVPAHLWQVTGADVRFVYVPGACVDAAPPTVIAYEPAAVGAKRILLKSDGTIIVVHANEIDSLLGSTR